MGCRRAAFPVHGKLLLGMAGGEAMTAHAETGAPCPGPCSTRCWPPRTSTAAMFHRPPARVFLFDMLPTRTSTWPGGQRHGSAPDRRREVAVLPPPPGALSQQLLPHLRRRHAAGYFSYKWAEVLPPTPTPPSRKPATLLTPPPAGAISTKSSVGGSRPALESFKAFRGREPRVDALLRHSGMIAA